MSGGRIALLVTGIVLALVALGAMVGGAVLVWAHTMERNADGYLTSPTYQLVSEGYALTGEEVDFQAGAAAGNWVPWDGRLRVRLTVDSPTADVFVGVASQDDLDRYLSGVAHDQIVRLGGRGDQVEYAAVPGEQVPAAPASEDLWVAQAQGPGPVTLDWAAEDGRWAVAVLNADASPGIVATITAGAAVEAFLPIGLGLLIGGLVLLAGGAVCIVVAAAATTARRTTADEPAGAGVAVGAGTYPVVLEARLDEPLNRALWLVKWFLAIPHLLVLAFLWLAFPFLTLVAGVAILVTGRYPRAIFDLTVGIIRWNWRVAFYATSALGTDRYPPFTLAAVPYPATFDVAYPERLSRGLVLVKWWLLAIPHYIVVAFLAGGWLAWTAEPGRGQPWTVSMGGGLIGILVLVAGFALLFTGRYPQGLFDLVLGFNRWVYRVLAYAALLTDDYPPFRLDSGGGEPRPVVPGPPPQPASGSESDERRPLAPA